MDGVLSDTETLYRRMNKHFLLTHGHSITDEEYDEYIGIHAVEMWGQWKNKYRLDKTIDQLVTDEKNAKFRMLNRERLEAMDGLMPLLKTLNIRKIKLAVASSSLRKNVDLVLSKLAIADQFECIKCGDEVINGKPHPEIFLSTATELSAKPSECVVVEDSKNGILAAKSAGMFAIGLQRDSSGQQDLSMADLIVNHLSEITMAMFP